MHCFRALKQRAIATAYAIDIRNTHLIGAILPNITFILSTDVLLLKIISVFILYAEKRLLRENYRIMKNKFNKASAFVSDDLRS
jgi:hypothetical protein